MKSSTRIIEKLSKLESSKTEPASKQGKLHEIKLTEDALENHISSYANAMGLVDMQSIHDTCIQKMHFSEAQANEVAANIMNRAWYCNVPGVYYSLFSGIYGSFKPKEGFPLFLLAYDGGLYDDNGGFREDLFQILQSRYAIEDWDGEKLISKAKMKEFLEKETKQRERLSTANWSYQQFAYNDIEFNTFFDKAVYRNILNKETNQMEGYVNVLTLKIWYVNTKIQMDRMSRETIPDPEEILSPAIKETLGAIL